jgi:hypothetical protein
MERMAHHSDWVFLIISVAGVVLLYMRLGFPRRFTAFGRYIVNTRSLDAFYNPTKPIVFDTFLLLRNMVFYSVIPLSFVVGLRALNQTTIERDDWKLFAGLTLFLLIFIQIQRMVTLALSWIFGRFPELNTFHFSKIFTWSWRVLLLLPLSFLTTFQGAKVVKNVRQRDATCLFNSSKRSP